jgi:phosphoribosylpyrophosphate synthetase
MTDNNNSNNTKANTEVRQQRSVSDHEIYVNKSINSTWMLRREQVINETTSRRYVVLTADSCSDHGIRLQNMYPNRFKYFPICWGKFPDGTDDILISGFQPKNEIAGEHVLFLASFHNNDVTLSQFSVLIVLLQSFIESLTIVLPFYPVGTMERVDTEGRVATANTYSILLSNLPTAGKPTRLMIYDIHALQNRFYFHSSTIPSLHTTIPLLFKKITTSSITTVAFPDDGAAKRFGSMFSKYGLEIIICGKVRDGLTRKITIQDGDPNGRFIIFFIFINYYY